MEKFIIKEKEEGFVMIAGVLKGSTFKANNGQRIAVTTFDKLYNDEFSAKINTEMLNHYRRTA